MTYSADFLQPFNRLVAFDAETTGKRTPDAEFIKKQPFAWRPPGIMIELGFVEMLRDGAGWKKGEAWASLVNPDGPIEPAAIKVHGIKPNDLKHAPRFPQLLERVRDFIGDSPIIAHAWRNERGLAALLQAGGIDVSEATRLAELGTTAYATLDKRVGSGVGENVRVRLIVQHNGVLTSGFVVAGEVEKGPEWAPARFDTGTPMTVVWSDQANALPLSRAWLKAQPEGSALLLVTGASKSDYAAAKSHAETCASTIELEGTPVKAVSELPVTLPTPRRPALKKSTDPAVAFQDETVILWTKGVSYRRALKDVPLDCRYYLVSNAKGCFNKQGDVTLEMRDTPANHQNRLATLGGWFGFEPLAGWVQLPRTQDILRLRLDAQGYKPYLWSLRERVEACRPLAREQLAQIRFRFPPAASSEWTIRDTFAHRLLHAVHLNPSAVRTLHQFIAGLGHSPLGTALLELHENYGKRPLDFDAGFALNALLSQLNCKGGVLPLQMASNELENVLVDAAPGLKWLNKTHLFSQVQADPFETGQRLRTLLAAAEVALVPDVRPLRAA